MNQTLSNGLPSEELAKIINRLAKPEVEYLTNLTLGALRQIGSTKNGGRVK